MSRRRKPLRACSFPGDPRYAKMTLTATEEEFACLGKKEFLVSSVLDSILQSTALPKDVSEGGAPPMIASFLCEDWMDACNATASTLGKKQSELKESQIKVEKIRKAVSQVIDDKATPALPQRLIIPMVCPGHFFVACFDFCVLDPNFFLDISFYDSLVHGKERITEKSTAGKTVKTVNLFFNRFILHDKKYRSVRQSNTDALQRVHYKACPMQKNGYDCGIFAVASTLHLAERITLTSTSFSQSQVTKARSELAKTYATAGALMTSSVFRDCFPLLRGRTIVDAMGFEVINTSVATSVDGKAAAAFFRRSTRSTNPTLFVGDGVSASTALTLKCWEEDIAPGDVEGMPKKNEKALPVGNKRKVQVISLTTETEEEEKKEGKKKTGEKRKGREVPDTTRTTTSTITTSASLNDGDKDVSDNSTNGDDRSETTGDTALYRIMHSAKVDCFDKLEDTSPIIEKYEATTGNRLRIQQSIVDRYRVYRCTSHEACPFLVRFSRSKDGKFILTKMNPKHGLVVRPNRAADGRQLKKRRQGKIDEMIVRVLETKDRPPVPADIIKTASNKEYNEDLPYMAAWRALNQDVVRQKKTSVMNFQLIIPYVEELRKWNPLSVIGYTRGSACESTFNIVDLYFFPAIANDVLKLVRPVISLDAAHLRSEFKGMLYIASVLSGGDDVYPLGFMISSGNEDRKTWTKMLGLLKEACPIITQQGFSAVHGKEDAAAPPQAERTQFLFVSDRDKGLKPALKEVFPDNVEMSCAKHIEANVMQKFGKKCSSHVMAMAKTYSVRYYEYVLEQIRTKKPSAATYVEDISERGTLWSNSQWSEANQALPPRFGIVTSNTAESVNSMFNTARDLPWMDALEKLIDVMVKRICNCRAKYEGKDGSKVLARAERLINRRWEATAAISVMELENGRGVYTTSSCDHGGVEDDDDDPRSLSRRGTLPLQRNSTHIVKPDDMWCSCGVWQDTLLPCRHACAVYRKTKSVEKEYILANLVHEYYTYSYVQQTFTKNIFPVSLDTLAYDRETGPPSCVKRGSGRPRTKRIRRRSLYAATEDSPIVCSNCGQAGHNKRTCSGKERAKAVHIPTDANVVEATQDEETEDYVNDLLGLAKADGEEDDESTNNEVSALTGTES
jgi:ribosomal protein L32